VFWQPLLLAVPVLVAAITALILDAALGAARARFPETRGRWRLRVLTGLLYLLQPLARLSGRIGYGLTPWRHRGPRAFSLPRTRDYAFWSERWQSTEDRVRAVVVTLQREGSVIRSGGDWDRWDLQVRGGMLGMARLRVAIEEHGSGRQLIRVRSWPHIPRGALLLALFAPLVGILAVVSEFDAVTLILGALAVGLLLRLVYECGTATAAIRRALGQPLEHQPLEPAPSEPEPAKVLPLGDPVPG
jgi:hypothetical protein